MATTVFGQNARGADVHLITLASDRLEVKLLTQGANIQDVRLAGIPHALTLGTDDLAAYEGKLSSCGSLVGPVVNRISGASAEINGKRYAFAPNLEGHHTIHSGPTATHKRLWDLIAEDARSATLGIDLPDGEGGFPGNRQIRAAFSVADNALTLEITARTDAPTLLNIANHSYWNLDGAGTTEAHSLQIHADRVLEPGELTLPTGKILDVAGTRLDFRTAKPVPTSMDARLDHNFCLADKRRELTPAAELRGASGVTMLMETTEPGLQVYDAANLEGPGRDGAAQIAFGGLALEAQGWPDSPNQSHFPSILVQPDALYRQVTRWSFTS